MAIATHTSGKTAVLELLFPQWRELVAAILWEMIDRVPPGTVLLKIKKWFLSFDVTIEEFAACVTLVFGPRPSN